MKIKNIFVMIISVLFAIIMYRTFLGKSYFNITVGKFDNGNVQYREKTSIDIHATIHDFIRYDLEGKIDKIIVYLDSMQDKVNHHHFTFSFQNEKNNIVCFEHFINEETVGFWVLDTTLYRDKVRGQIESVDSYILYTIENIQLSKKRQKDTKEFELELKVWKDEKESLLKESRMIKVKEKWIEPVFNTFFTFEENYNESIVHLKKDARVSVMKLYYGQNKEVTELRVYNYRNYKEGDYYKLEFEKKAIKRIQQFIDDRLVDNVSF